MRKSGKLFGSSFICAAALAFPAVLSAANVEVRVDSGETPLSACPELASLGTTDTLVKVGDGKLLITNELLDKGYIGNIIVSNGIIRLNAANATGPDSDATFTVVDGAAVEIGPEKYSNGAQAIRGSTLYLSGTGVNNSGAAFANGSNQQSYLTSKGSLTLIGDTLIKGIAAGFGPSGKYVNLGGHVLTLDGGKIECRGVSFTGPGEIVVKRGTTFYLENVTPYSMGDPKDAKITVEDGGTMLIGGNAASSSYLSAYSKWPVVFEGDATWTIQTWTDAVMGWNGPFQVGGTLTFAESNTHVLTNFIYGAVTGTGSLRKKGIRTVVLSNAANAIDGDITVEGGTFDYTGSVGGVVVSGGAMKMNGGEIANDVTVSGGTFDYTGSVGGDVNVSGGTFDYTGSVGGGVFVSGGTLNMAGEVASDVNVSGGTFNHDGSLACGLAVSGAGSAVVSGSVEGSVSVLSSGASARIGGPIGSDIFGAAGASLTVDLSKETSEIDDLLLRYWRKYTSCGATEWDGEKSSTLYFNMHVIPPANHTFTAPLEKDDLNTGVIVTHSGDSALTIASEEFVDQPSFKNTGSGELVIDPQTEGPAEVSWIDVQKGQVTIPADADIQFNTKNLTIAAAYPEVARLAIKGRLTTTNYRTGIDPSENAVSRPSGSVRGICEIFDGALVTNVYRTSESASTYVRTRQNGNANTLASWYQHGGDVRLWGDKEIGSQTHYYPGTEVNFFYSLEGGTYSHGSAKDVRFSSSADKYAVFAQSGGTNLLAQAGDGIPLLTLAAGDGRVTYYLSRGLITGQNGQLMTCKENWENAQGTARVSFTVDGPEAVVDLPVWADYDSVTLCRQIRAFTEINLLNGGTFGCNCIAKAASGVLNNSGKTGPFTDNVAELNFDGGTLVMSGPREDDIVFRNFNDGVDRVRVFEGGATIDTARSSSRPRILNAALEAPTGNGVKSIALTDAFLALPAWEFTGAPKVEIVDATGAGKGATAVAVFDTLAGKVTGVKVMNPGSGYPTTGVVAKLSQGGSPNTYELPCTVAANVSGDFTKKGAGTLVLNRPCTYTGRTVLAGGTLMFGCEHAVDSRSRFILAGGTVDLDGYTLSDGATAVTDWGLDVAVARANGAGTYASLSLPVGSTLTVSGADKLPTAEEDPTLHRVDLLTVTEGLVGLPAPTFDEAPTTGWTLKNVGNTVCLVRAAPLTLLLK